MAPAPAPARPDPGSHSSFVLPIGILSRGDSPFIGEKERRMEGEGGKEGRKEGATFA